MEHNEHEAGQTGASGTGSMPMASSIESAREPSTDVMSHQGESLAPAPNKRKRTAIIIAVAILVIGTLTALFLTGVLSFKKLGLGGNDVAAVVNGEKILVSYIDERIAQARPTLEAQGFNFDDETAVATLRSQAVTNLVNETLLIQKSKESGIEITDEDLEKEYQSIVTSLGGEEGFNAALASINLTAERLRIDLRRQLYVERYVDGLAAKANITVTDAEVKTAYDGIKKDNPSAPPYADIKETLRTELRQQKVGQLVTPHIDELRTAANIEIK